MKRPRPRSLLVLSNFNVATCDHTGAQIPDLQVNLLELWASHAESMGYDVRGLIAETNMGTLQLLKTVDGWRVQVCKPIGFSAP